MENAYLGDAPAPYEQITITLSDGVVLTGRLWLPERPAAAKVPVVLEWIPYRQSDNTAVGDSMVHGYFAMSGIASVRVDLRGSGNSEGLLHDEYLKQEQDDACEVIAWLAAQEWCNGKVGLIGISWGGFAGLQIAARRPPALKAIVTCCSTDDRYSDDVHFMGGGLLIDGLQWGAGLFAQLGRPADPAHVGARWRDIWMNRLENLKPPLASWLAHMQRDDFWKHGSICEDYDAIRCPVYAVTGWTDGYSDPVLRLMQNLKGPRKGLIGPWTHMYPNWGVPGPKIGFLEECMRWWRHWLLDEPTGIMDEPMLRLWVGEDLKPHPRLPTIDGRWIDVPHWPCEGTPQAFHPDDRMLASAPAVGAAPVRVATPQNLGAYAGEWCPLDGGGDGPEFQADNRPDDALSVCWDTPVLKEAIEIVGVPRLKLDLAMDGSSALVIVRLNEIAPDGTSARVTFAIRRMTRPEGVAAGERFASEIPLKGVAYRFKLGCRIRLAVSTTYWPMVWPEHRNSGITLYPDATVFLLPGMPAQAVHELPPFDPPVSAAPIPSEDIQSGDIIRRLTWDATTGVSELVNTNQRTTWRLGDLTLGGRGLHGYSIRPDDPASARAWFESVQRYERPGWAIRLETRSDVFWEDGKLVLESRYEALENDAAVFSRQWRHSFDY
ncbi:MAG: peptidase S15 [Ancylobacter novellus]|uniref:Peptidase S15 n=1 Tax=Ancylobacter novellus TaxID=921 RepID=A0A2W5QN44_ANCNO|nr:MAG: peptidase S15 [Ancylobacter novellus]